MIKPISIAVVLIVLTSSSGNAGSGCAVGPANLQCHPQVDLVKAPISARWKLAVLCCCVRYSGSECCTQVAQCGEKIPGCFCASPSVPGSVQLSAARR
jgi:hypothetical protein